MVDNIIAGIVSGLLATFLVVVLRALWLQVIVPWFEERVYKDIKIEGVWFALYPTVISYRQETVNIVRQGHAVDATMVCNVGNDQGEQYVAAGSFRNLILTLTYETRDRTKVDRGSITLRCVKNGTRLVGKAAIYYDPGDGIDDYDLVWFRSKEDLEETLERIKKQDALAKRVRTQEVEARKGFEKLIERHSEPAQDGENEKEANKTPEPTTTAVTPPAAQEPRQP